MKKIIFCCCYVMLILYVVCPEALNAMDGKTDKTEQVPSPVIKPVISKVAQVVAFLALYIPKSDLVFSVTRWHIVLTIITGGLGVYAVRKWILYRIWSNTEEIKKVTKETKKELENLAQESNSNFSVAQQERKDITNSLAQQGEAIEHVKSKTDSIDETVTDINDQVKSQKNFLEKLQNSASDMKNQLEAVKETITVNNNMVEEKVEALKIVVKDGFDEHNKRCDNIEEKLDILEPTIKKMITENLEKNSAQTNTQLQEINKQLEALKKKEKFLSTQLSSLQETLTNNHTGLQDKLQQLGVNVGSLTNSVHDSSSHFDELDKNVGFIKNDISSINNGISNIEKRMDKQAALMEQFIINQQSELENSKKFLNYIVGDTSSDTPKDLLLTDK